VLGNVNEEMRHVSKNITIFATSANPIETFWNCKIGVGSPGNMLWERGSVGIPSYVIMNNPNQEKICTELHKAGLLELGRYDKNSTLGEEIESIQTLFYDRGKLDKMSQKLRDSINIQGKSLLVKEILQEMH
jgi:spore coat polysaccharide biosynthesis predicted glycosyltransferase SpsG